MHSLGIILFLFKKEEGFMANEEKELWDLYEQYMNEEEINEIIEEDEKASKKEEKKNKSHTESKFPTEISISIADYVNNYLGISSDCSNLWHQGLKDIGSNFVFGVSNDFANKNPERVYKGELLLVVDTKGNRGTYINPKYLQELIHKDDVEKELSTLRKTGVRDLQLLADYLDECVRLQAQIETNRKFEQLLYETHKLKKFKELKKEINHD